MCVVSMMIDHKTEKWRQLVPQTTDPYFLQLPYQRSQMGPSKAELDEFRELLRKAREYDKKNSEPECEMADKKRILKEIAEKLGVDVSFVDEA